MFWSRPFSEGDLCAEKQQEVTNIVSLVKMVENLPSTSSFHKFSSILIIRKILFFYLFSEACKWSCSNRTGIKYRTQLLKTNDIVS